MTNTVTQLVVPALTVHVVTGDTCYGGEGGFSAIYSEVQTTDPDLIKSLSNLQNQKVTALLRCAMVDVIGRVTKCETVGEKTIFVVVVEDLRYRKPERPGTA